MWAATLAAWEMHSRLQTTKAVPHQTSDNPVPRSIHHALTPTFMIRTTLFGWIPKSSDFGPLSSSFFFLFPAAQAGPMFVFGAET